MCHGCRAPEGAASFFRGHRGQPLASSALMRPMSRRFVAAFDRFITQHALPLVVFGKGQRKDDVMAERLRSFAADEGIVFVGKAQEKASVFRTTKRHNPRTGRSYPWIVKSTAMVNHYYIYAVDRDFGPFFVKFCTYFPYTAKLCLNGYEYAKRQLAREGIAFQALDNSLPRRRPGASRIAPIPSVCSRFVTACPLRRSSGCCASGSIACRTPSPPPTARPATATRSQSCRRSSRGLPVRRTGGHGPDDRAPGSAKTRPAGSRSHSGSRPCGRRG
jgi:hypothetical protein